MRPSRNDIRNDNATGTTPTPAPASRNDIRNDNHQNVTCPVCTNTFVPVRRQRYCTPACRQAAWRARRRAPRPTIVVPPTSPRRAITVYQCPTCETRYLGQQYCHDCHTPCVRIDLGGRCPHCDEPVAISGLLAVTSR